MLGNVLHGGEGREVQIGLAVVKMAAAGRGRKKKGKDFFLSSSA